MTTTLPVASRAATMLFGGFLPVGGRSADLFGGKRVFLIGGTVFGVSSLATGLGGLAATPGVVLSGVITEYAGWRWCFLINVPVAVEAPVMVDRLLPDHRPARTGTRLDCLSAALVTGAIAAVGETHADITGLASGLVTTTQQLGGALGLGVLSTVALRHTAGGSLTSGFQLAYQVSAATLAVATVLTLVGITATARTSPANA
ncbi:hypothetical protein NS14008_38175 [Nocardia seriolae]|uniref:hypothetical protein n=1 Tax=Nocardia seriolae TaxID=37332 RepID=UPI0008FF7173|nr:hypothetical protein [Nocardia seriolae]OJF77838.1 hypothetical protein NS14008_38175 [Nocardia seriolae]